MTIPDFEDALAKGLGRAILFLKSCPDPNLYLWSVADAILTDQTWDWTDSRRGDYLWQAVEATGSPEWFVAAARRGLASTSEAIPTDQVYAVAEELTAGGFCDLRPEIYEAARRGLAKLAEEDWSGAETLVRLDGLEGYVFAFDHARPGDPDGPDNDAQLQELLEVTLGKRAARSALATLTGPVRERSDAAFRRRIERVGSWRQNRLARKTPQAVPPIDEILASLTQSSGRWIAWGKWADDETHRAVAAHCLTLTDRKSLMNALMFFRREPWPLEPSLLFDFVRRRGKRLQHRAWLALRHRSHPDVRALGDALARRKRLWFWAEDCWASNPLPGDWERLTEFLERARTRKEFHDAVWNLHDYSEALPDGEQIPVLVRAFSATPCAMCRMSVVRRLVALGGLTDALQEECRYDSDEGTREATVAQ